MFCWVDTQPPPRQLALVQRTDTCMMPLGGLRHIGRRLIHPSAWKGNSANFALTEFSEVRLDRFLARMHILPHTSPPTRSYLPRSLLPGPPLRGWLLSGPHR